MSDFEAKLFSRSVALEGKPIKPLDAGANGEKVIINIPRRQKSVTDPVATMNGNGDTSAPYTNGTGVSKRKATDVLETNGSVKKRPAPEALENDRPTAKRSKVVHKGGPPADDDLIELDDAADGAIVIEDD